MCTHPSYNDKSPRSVCIFLYPYFKIPFLKSGCSEITVSSSAQDVPTIADWQGCLTSDSSWVSCELSSIVLTPMQGKTRMSLIKRLRCSVVGCNNEYYSRHLLRTSELLKTQRINVTFDLKGMRPRSPICLNASIFTQIIRDPASPTDEVSMRDFMNLCKSPFLITC